MEILAVRSVVELVLTDNFKVLRPFVPEVVFSLHQSAPEVTEATHLAAALEAYRQLIILADLQGFSLCPTLIGYAGIKFIIVIVTT